MNMGTLSLHAQRQKLETLINEDALLLAKYLRARDEKKDWVPRIAREIPKASISV
jgi:hypothetical protein